jgi:hypothetical protein
MRATLTFTLPDEQGNFDAARLGSDALLALWEIDQHCRSLLKHGDPSEDAAALAQAIQGMITDEMRKS